MIALWEPNTSKPLAEAYSEFLTNLRVRQAKVCSVLCLVLVPACGGLDYFVYPRFAVNFMIVRLLHDVLMVPCLLILLTAFGRRHIKLLDDLWALPPTLAICWMIYVSEGIVSPYYAGLNLVIIGGCLIIPYSMGEAIVFSMLVVVGYSAACILHTVGTPMLPLHSAAMTARSITFNNLYFLILTAVICSTACYYASKKRFEEFRLRYELDVNNTELATTIGKLQETEVQLVQSEKMNALGKLSAGLLHEINNPLNFTFMALQVAEGEAGENESLKETLADIHHGMSRIRGVIADLRSFAYPSKPSDAQEFCLCEALTAAIRLTAHELKDVVIEQPEGESVKAIGSKNQVIHIFMNLLVNSAHAMKDKSLGRSPKIAVGFERLASRVKVVVKDNGTGVSDAARKKMFEPFFTTKGPGEGTGLGLSICDTIVKSHGGTMFVETEIGQWTRIGFDLPVSSSEVAPSAPILASNGSKAA